MMNQADRNSGPQLSVVQELNSDNFPPKKGSISKALLIKAPATLELLGVSSKLFKYHKLNSWTLLQPALS